MTFFDSKEDVIDIELTQFGKYLLSKGKWMPVYYSFYDDDVIYDATYGGIVEGQNQAQDRITGSIRPRTQYAFSGIETEIAKLMELAPYGGSEKDRISLQATDDRDYALSLAMGRSDIGNQSLPAWSITFLNGEITGSVPYSTSSLGIIPIVQLEAQDVSYVTEIKNKNDEDADELCLDETLNQVGESANKADPSDLILANKIYDDGTYVSIEEDYLLLEILENNTPFEDENLDIEVFSYETNLKTNKEVLTPLKFFKKKQLVVDDILIDDDEPELNQQAELTPDFVEYFFNVYVDDEISEETLCKAVVQRRDLGLYAPPIKCPEPAPKVCPPDQYRKDDGVVICDEEPEEC